MTTYQVLKKYYGYDSFRQGQEQIIDALVVGRDALAIMPTGAGKSVCFQIPALLLSGITLVISPLISLMKDQVTQLVQMGIPAAFLNNSLTPRQYALALSRACAGHYKLIYVAPERLLNPTFLDFVQSVDISMVAVDEAHCISQWGQDFRPAYLSIPDFIARLPRRPVLGAFTATATPEVRQDIEQQLALHQPLRVVTGFNRENLYFEVRQAADKRQELLDIVHDHVGECGIVYCATRKNVEEACSFLQRAGISATRYHAGLAAQERRENQENFLFGRVTVMVATNAFGMGIDKSDVRYVVHYNMPKDMESYYQEAGRAGRDGMPSVCILLYSGQDVRTNEFLIKHREQSAERDSIAADELLNRDLERLRQMTFYCHSKHCLRQYILEYFGEQATGYCENCYNCLHNYEEVDVTAEAQTILRCIAETGQRFGMGIIVAMLRGSENEKIRQYQLQNKSTHGALRKFSQKAVQERIRFLLDEHFLQQSEGQYPVLIFAERAEEAQLTALPLIMKTVKEEEKTLAVPKSKGAALALNERQTALFERLRTVRITIAKERGIPAFVVFSDKTLVEMASKEPQDSDELLMISGIGVHKAELYGEAFLQEIAAFGAEF